MGKTPWRLLIWIRFYKMGGVKKKEELSGMVTVFSLLSPYTESSLLQRKDDRIHTALTKELFSFVTTEV